MRISNPTEATCSVSLEPGMMESRDLLSYLCDLAGRAL